MLKKFIVLVAVVFLGAMSMNRIAEAQSDTGFSVRVTPSPIVATVEPGELTTLELRINNTGSRKENFTMGMSSFDVADDGQIVISDEVPSTVGEFVTFEKPQFTLEPNEWLTQKIFVNTPEDAGFSYNFAILIKRDGQVVAQNGGAALEGSVAVFTLLNVNRPDAVRSLEIESIRAIKKTYEYLPVDIEVTVKNTGNTIVAPKGNMFFSRQEDDVSALSTIVLNEAGGNILPGATRTFTVRWSSGFPVYEESQAGTKLVWDYAKLSDLRIGKYNAKLVMIYDDGERDVPLEATVGFWVIPWKIIIGVIIVILLLVIGVFTLFKNTARIFAPKKNKE